MPEEHMTTALCGEMEDRRGLCCKLHPGAEDPEGTADLGKTEAPAH